MKKFYIKLLDKKINFITEIECNINQTILEAAENVNIFLPYSCRNGLCSTCVAKINNNGIVEQKDQHFLSNEQIKKGYILTCISYPKSNLILEINEEDNLY